MSESGVLRVIWRAISQGATRVFRNNQGEAWLGKWSWAEDGHILIEHPQRVHYGLLEGSADLIGWTEYTIMADDVGRKVAVFTSIEVKSKAGRPSDEQLHWANMITAAGGIACVARETRDAAVAIEGYSPV